MQLLFPFELLDLFCSAQHFVKLPVVYAASSCDFSLLRSKSRSLIMPGLCAPPGRSRTLLVLLLFSFSSRLHCHGLTDTVLAELASHLQLDASRLQEQSTADWGRVVSIQRSLQGTGFHRSLRLQIAPAAPGSSTHSAGGCRLSLLQPLPRSIFADPYQLEDLTRSTQAGYDYTFSLLGPLDLEL